MGDEWTSWWFLPPAPHLIAHIAANLHPCKPPSGSRTFHKNIIWGGQIFTTSFSHVFVHICISLHICVPWIFTFSQFTHLPRSFLAKSLPTLLSGNSPGVWYPNQQLWTLPIKAYIYYIHFTTENATRPQGQDGLGSDEVVEGEVDGNGKEDDEEEPCVGEHYM